jgi:leucyl/phenylalanyl-tRNA---protein transferase
MTQSQKEITIPHPLESDEDGFLCYDELMDAKKLLAYYQLGVFPWYSIGKKGAFFFPPFRYLIDPSIIKTQKSLRPYFNQNRFIVTYDQCFTQVMKLCSKVERRGTHGSWINSNFIKIYTQLHQLGLAHSVEVWMEDELVGGLYGVSMGRIFSGESMFSLRPNASKLALICLAKELTKRDFQYIDCQIKNDYLESFGGHEISKYEFFEFMVKNMEEPTIQGNWGKIFTTQ